MAISKKDAQALAAASYRVVSLGGDCRNGAYMETLTLVDKETLLQCDSQVFIAVRNLFSTSRFLLNAIPEISNDVWETCYYNKYRKLPPALTILFKLVGTSANPIKRYRSHKS